MDKEEAKYQAFRTVAIRNHENHIPDMNRATAFTLGGTEEDLNRLRKEYGLGKYKKVKTKKRGNKC